MTVPEFERAALAAIALIPGAVKLKAEVTPDVVHVACEIDLLEYELTYAYDDQDATSRERAFAAVLRGIESTRLRYVAAEPSA